MNPFEQARRAQERALRRLRRARPAPAAPSERRSPSQQRGDRAEQRAADHVQRHGARILARQLRARGGEIDLLLWHEEHLVFLEVRQRNSHRFGGALASVTRDKQRRLILAARQWLPALARRHFQGRLPPCRFDVIAIEGESLRWIRNAFADQ